MMNFDLLFDKIVFFLKRLYKREILTYLFFIFAVVSCVFTYCFFYNIELFNQNSKKVISILYFDVIFILIFLVLASKRIGAVWNSRHKKGSRFTLKLISIFSFVSILPSILMCIFSSIFFQNGLEAWFNERNQTVLKDSLNVASSYFNETRESALHDSIAISRVVENNLEVLYSRDDEESLSRSICFLLDDLCNLKGISSAILLNSYNSIIAHTKYSVGLHFLNITDDKLQELKKLADQQKNGTILELKGTEKDKILIAVCFRLMTESSDGNRYIYLITEKKISSEILTHVDNAKNAYQEYYNLLDHRESLEKAFILMFFVIGLLILIISIVLAIFFSWRIIKPISSLIDVSETVMAGDLSARAEEDFSSGSEISDLTKAFNQMISKVHKQQNELIAINSELDDKVKFITNVLSGISSGVIGLDNFCIYIWNKKAEELLGKAFVFGENIFNVFSEIQELTDEINEDVRFVSKEIQYRKNNETFLFSVKIVNIASEEYSRYVVTFDDLTNMVISQHKAAWSEVARRVAHEIKNPLTPIQLSAERLHRKYISQISEDKDTFSKLINVIVRQVGDIKRLIDEFNFFARLPEPKLKKCNLEEICSQAIFLMSDVSSNVKIYFSKVGTFFNTNGDDQLLHQCIVNLIKNAANALSTIEKDEKGIWVTLKSFETEIQIDIEDNGPGLPKDKIDSLTTPYFTLLPKGTGLGLAIVKKIIQDHNGVLSFGQSSHENGAKVTLTLPLFMDKRNEV